MGIEYNPIALGEVINGSYAAKRLRNREGFAVAIHQQTQAVSWQMEGPLLDVHAQAVEFDTQNPQHTVRVVEHSCDTNVVMPNIRRH